MTISLKPIPPSPSPHFPSLVPNHMSQSNMQTATPVEQQWLTMLMKPFILYLPRGLPFTCIFYKSYRKKTHCIEQGQLKR